MIRRLKKDVLQQLPPKKRYIHKINIQDPCMKANLKRLCDDIQRKCTATAHIPNGKDDGMNEDQDSRSENWLDA